MAGESGENEAGEGQYGPWRCVPFGGARCFAENGQHGRGRPSRRQSHRRDGADGEWLPAEVDTQSNIRGELIADKNFTHPLLRSETRIGVKSG